MKGVLGAFFAQVVIITYKATAGGVRTPATAPLPVPLPASYTGAALIYGGLSILPAALAPVTTLVAWGLVVATLLNVFPLAPKAPSVTAASKATGSLGAVGSTTTTGLAPAVPKIPSL